MSVLIFNFVSKSRWEHLTFAAKLEIGAKSQEPGARSQEPGARRNKEGARRSVFTNMRCSRLASPRIPLKKGTLRDDSDREIPA
jgi:hypothetical protein